MSLSVINARLDLVTEFLEHDQLREEVMSALQKTSDVLRLLQKFSIGKGDADDLLALAKTVQIIDHIHDKLNFHLDMTRKENGELRQLAWLKSQLDMQEPTKLAARILDAINEDGLSQKHLVEQAEVADMAELAEQVEQEEEAESKITKRGKKKSPAPAEPIPGEIWIMRRR